MAIARPGIKSLEQGMADLLSWTAPGSAYDAGSDGSGNDLRDERARPVMNGH